MTIRPAIASVTFLVSGVFAQSMPSPMASYQQEIRSDPSNSLAHYRLGELYFREKNYGSAASEFQASLNGDLRPAWTEAWSHIQLGNLFGITGQADRAANEYHQAGQVERQQANTWDPAVVGGVERPKLLDLPVPEYSDEARLAGLEGTVVLTVGVTAEGTVGAIQVESPLGLGLDERAIDAVRRCRFEAGKRNGSPAPMKSRVAVDFMLPKKVSRWHLLRAQFHVPEGVSRATFHEAGYPAGIGVSGAAIDEGRILGAIGRQGTATLSFDVDEQGAPGHFQVQSASLDLWGNEAIAFVREWRFRPGMKNGQPVAVPCTVDLAWGQRKLTTKSIEWARTSLQGMQRDPAQTESPILVLTASEGAYTAEALSARVEGIVTLQLLLGEDGGVRDTSVVQALGYGLDEVAMQMVRAARFPAAGASTDSEAPPYTAKVIFHMNGPASGPRD